MAAMKNNSPVRAWNGINEPWLQQTRQTLESLKNTLKARENATDSLVRQAWFKADKALRELGLYKGKILSLSQSAVEVANREYEAGIIPFSQAIGSYTDWLNVRLTIAQKNADLGTAFAELEAIIGKSLR
jgi:outer membrane protein TolC